MKSSDVTHAVEFGINDEESLPMTKCLCGQHFDLWDFIIGKWTIPTPCPTCGRKYYFENDIRVRLVIEE